MTSDSGSSTKSGTNGKKYPTRCSAILPDHIRKYSGLITAIFCLQVSFMMGLETSYVASFSGHEIFESIYHTNTSVRKGVLQGSYPFMACCNILDLLFCFILFYI